MKELSIEEKAQRYNEALKRAKKLYEQGTITESLSYVFPELKENESEDEKIRKELITWLKNSEGQTLPIDKYNAAIAWLEKQGNKDMGISNTTKQKLKDNLDNALEKETPESWNKFLERQGEQKPADKIEPIEWSGKINSRNAKGVLKEVLDKKLKSADKIEPKFKVGDWLIYNTSSRNPDICIVTEITDDLCKNRKIGEDKIRDNSIEFVNRNYRLWTIQDAKEGDVLASNRSIFIFSQEYMAGKPEAYCGVMNGLFIVEPEGCWTNEKCYPATKEQRDFLFSKMKEAGYEWNAEKKELKKIEQNPAWSEDDQSNFNELSGFILETYRAEDASRLITWLNSIKERVQPRQEWSKEDESILQGIWDEILANKHDAKEYECKTYDKFLDWLKSLRPHYRWKPSEEQMKALEAALTVSPQCPAMTSALIELYEQLKKLRNE